MSSQSHTHPLNTVSYNTGSSFPGLTTRPSQIFCHDTLNDRDEKYAILRRLGLRVYISLYVTGPNGEIYKKPCKVATHLEDAKILVNDSVSVKDPQSALVSAFEPSVQAAELLGDINKHMIVFAARMATYATFESNANAALRADLGTQCEQLLEDADKVLVELLDNSASADLLQHIRGRRNRIRLFVHTHLAAISSVLIMISTITLAYEEDLSALIAIPIVCGLTLVGVGLAQAVVMFTGFSAAIVKKIERSRNICATTHNIRLAAIESLMAYCEYYAVFSKVLAAFSAAQDSSADERERGSYCILSFEANHIPESDMTKFLDFVPLTQVTALKEKAGVPPSDADVSHADSELSFPQQGVTRALLLSTAYSAVSRYLDLSMQLILTGKNDELLTFSRWDQLTSLTKGLVDETSKIAPVLLPGNITYGPPVLPSSDPGSVPTTPTTFAVRKSVTKMRPVRPRVFDGQIQLSDVLFASPARSEVASVRDVNISLLAGDPPFVVGDSGAGKSTIAQLVSGVYDNYSGIIWIDDRDVRYIDQDQLRSNIACVHRVEGVVLEGNTMRENTWMGTGYNLHIEVSRFNQLPSRVQGLVMKSTTIALMQKFILTRL
ncbi:hypothetical protein GGF50DRAFT_120348 [Schizophyllum commune]